MKIAIVGPYFRPLLSGIEKIMDMQGRLLAERGHEVAVFTSKLRFPDGLFDVPDTEQIDNVTIHRFPVPMRRPPRPFSYPSNGGWIIRGLGSALRRFAPDVTHAHNIGAPAWAQTSAAEARRSGRAFFYSSYHHPDDLRFDVLRKFILRHLNRRPLSQAERIYHLTRSDFSKLLNDYPGAREDAFFVLPAGVAPPETGLPSREACEHSLLFVGRVDDARKGFAVLEAAYNLLRSRHGLDTPRLVVVGAMSDETRQRLASTYGNAIELAGLVDEAELERRYAAAGIFVMPSFYEGFGMPYIEAMRYGVPVIGTTVGGIPEVVPDGKGILVPPGDPVALAEALEQLIDSPTLRHTLGEEGRRWSERFHWSRIIDQLEADYVAATKNR